jgi:hypothetical protein
MLQAWSGEIAEDIPSHRFRLPAQMDLFFANSGALFHPKGLLSLSGSICSSNGFQESTQEKN